MSSIAYQLSHPKLKLELKLEKIEKLRIHEEVIPSLVERLSNQIQRDALIKHPIIVDKRSLVVLDGMHRLAVLQHLGYRLIPVCLVNYEDPNILVKRWFRTVQGMKGMSGGKFLDVLRGLGYPITEVPEEELDSAIDGRGALMGITTLEGCCILRGNAESVSEKYQHVKRLENSLRGLGFRVGYGTEEALRRLKLGELLAVVITPKARKEDVIRTALSGKLLIHKSTRHIIPARPLFVNVPLKWLKMDLERANELFVRSLRRRRLRRLPPGSVLDRLYEEELYIFE